MQTLPKERRYETLSYLPPLSDAQITRQIEYTLRGCGTSTCELQDNRTSWEARP
jgi:ribulose-bisphosphate carboxylase small chain